MAGFPSFFAGSRRRPPTSSACRSSNPRRFRKAPSACQNGVAILTRGNAPIETRRALPGDDDDLHSRYIEAAVDGLLIGCLYVPNGNPVKSEKFSFKLRW